MTAESAGSFCSTREIRILIVSGIRLFREGLAQALNRIDLLSVIGQESDRETALACLRDVAPDVMLLDMCVANYVQAAIGV